MATLKAKDSQDNPIFFEATPNENGICRVDFDVTPQEGVTRFAKLTWMGDDGPAESVKPSSRQTKKGE